jgi:Domain of unknown function (DUF4145)
MSDAIIVYDCPRCGAKEMTFDVLHTIKSYKEHDWKRYFEAFSVCRNCKKSTTIVIGVHDYDQRERFEKNAPTTINGSLNPHFDIAGHISLKDRVATEPPDHVPENIANAFKEAAVSVVTKSPNAAGAMFRLAIDLTTRPMLPTEEREGLNQKVRRDLGLRLPWLFKNGVLPRELEELSHCVREDGNDGAHAGNLTMTDALDLQDFTVELLKRIFTEPERIRLAAERRAQRRAADQKQS